MANLVGYYARSLLISLVPWKSISYYETYLSNVKQICQWPRYKMATLRIYLTMALLFARSSEYLVRFWQNPPPIRGQILSYDLPYFMTQNATFHLIWSTFGFMTLTFNYVLYFKSDHRTMILLKDILIRQKCDLFLFRRYGDNKDVYKLIRIASLKMLNFLQVFIVVAHISVIYQQVAVIEPKIKENKFLFSGLEKLYFWFNVFQHNFLVYDFACILILAWSLGFCLVVSFLLLMSQSNARLTSPHLLLWRDYYTFRDNYIPILSHLFRVNVWLGPLFTIFLGVNSPINAYLILWINLRATNSMLKFLNLCIVMAQLSCIFGLHLVFSLIPKLLHRPGSILVRLMIRHHHRVGDLRTRMRMLNTILAIHTTNRYGLTYAMLGLVTLSSFTKCLRLYGKIMMISFKMYIRDEECQLE